MQAGGFALGTVETGGAMGAAASRPAAATQGEESPAPEGQEAAMPQRREGEGGAPTWERPADNLFIPLL